MDEIRYLVIDEKTSGDTYTEAYTTLDEANDAASREWDHLSSFDKRRSHIHVGMVRREDLADWAEDEETGEIDWAAYEQYDRPEGAFDSAKE